MIQRDLSCSCRGCIGDQAGPDTERGMSFSLLSAPGSLQLLLGFDFVQMIDGTMAGIAESNKVLSPDIVLIGRIPLLPADAIGTRRADVVDSKAV